MYFWRIEKLKTEMAARPLSEREALPYMVVYVALCVALSYLPHPTRNLWDGLEAVWNVLLAAAGTLYIYRQNGGAKGRNFVQRYIAVGWVVSIRWFVILLPASLVFRGALSALGADTSSSHWYTALFHAGIGGILYWQVGHHVRDIAQKPTAGDPGAAGGR